ncbi:enoyl-CoA hydratase/isomerase family protein [Desulfocicer niacini]
MPILISHYNDSVRILTIDHPPVNALDQETIDALADAVKAAEKAPEIRVIVITGAGKLFVAGADLEELAVWDEKAGLENVSHVKLVMAMLRRCSKPVIAAINGLAAGGGLELAMACDIRIAQQGIRMGLPEVTLGVLPGAGGTQMLPRLVGVGKAFEMMLTGELVSVDQALAMGLIDVIAYEKSAVEQALELAEKMAQNAPLAMAGIKASVYATLSTSLEEGMAKETREFAKLCASEDKNIGIKAFKDRRKVVFQGR